MKAIEKPSISAIEEYAIEFFAMPVSEQNKWAQDNFLCSAVTFRRWCNACGIKAQHKGRSISLVK